MQVEKRKVWSEIQEMPEKVSPSQALKADCHPIRVEKTTFMNKLSRLGVGGMGLFCKDPSAYMPVRQNVPGSEQDETPEGSPAHAAPPSLGNAAHQFGSGRAARPPLGNKVAPGDLVQPKQMTPLKRTLEEGELQSPAVASNEENNFRSPTPGLRAMRSLSSTPTLLYGETGDIGTSGVPPNLVATSREAKGGSLSPGKPETTGKRTKK